jgi:SAM-dependent methyltransferase
MKTNRVLSREKAASLDLQSRIKLEMELTDANAQRFMSQSAQADWRFDTYRDRLPWRSHLFDFLGSLVGKTVLDLGCGYQPTPIYFALAGARKVYACDVSPIAVAHVQEMAEAAGVADRVNALVCAGEQLPFANEQIDIIHGEAVLHHLRLPLAGAEIARVLRHGGKAGFKDPLGHNRLLDLARDYLSYRWKASAKGTDRPLKFSDIEGFGRPFRVYTYRGFGLLSIVVVFIWGRGDSTARKIADALDSYLLRTFPFLQRFCRFVVTCVEK